jgi:hypothetical protein
MTQILQSLKEIITDYSIFTNNQVLTAEQLNSTVNFTDAQTRLTRVRLLGVGIASGLRVSLDNNSVKVTKGVGVTTDGDLLYYDKDTLFDRFNANPYGKSYPTYPPFYADKDLNKDMIGVFYELVRQDDTINSNGVSLSKFSEQTGLNLGDMIAVMFMESYEKNDNLCKATDCDNLGSECLNTIKLLLVDSKYANLLNPEIAQTQGGLDKLRPLTIDRAIFHVQLATLEDIVKSYKESCKSMHDKLIIDALPNLYGYCSVILTDIFTADPTVEWIKMLENLMNTYFGNYNYAKIQYYYDFLLDLIETYNNICELLTDSITWSCPDINTFPKHLLLDKLAPPESNDISIESYRMAFYPSPLVSHAAERLDHARFLVKKVDAMIRYFQLPYEPQFPQIHVYPDDLTNPLEEQQVPSYYHDSMLKKWNHRLYLLGKDATRTELQLSYSRSHATFFRIYGHLGREYFKGRLDGYPFSVVEVTVGTSLHNFVNRHPAIEHLGGVIRGGTLVLVYGNDTSHIVLADFMLPYYISEPSAYGYSGVESFGIGGNLL